MSLPRDVNFILERLSSRGYSAHVVGGAVRDSLIGRPLGDFDITTDALPEQTKACFSDFRTVDTGIKHGTVTLVLNGTPYEITTYRVDGDYKDNRHPDQVSFTANLGEDLARRDFTVNAMAYNPECGLCDPFGGRTDAEKKIIRAVGDPYLRFSEDALRILRALRFASVLGFEIEALTASAARELCENLSSISKERVYTEFKKLIMGKNALGVLREYAFVFDVSLGGFEVRSLPESNLFDRADYLTRLAALFLLNSSEPQLSADRVLTELKTDKFTRTHTVSVLSAYSNVFFDNQKTVLIALAKYGKEVIEGVLSLGILTGRFTDTEGDIFSCALECGIPYRISELAVRGTDLLSLGIKGEQVGEALNALLYAVIGGESGNDKTSLLLYLGKSK